MRNETRPARSAALDDPACNPQLRLFCTAPHYIRASKLKGGAYGIILESGSGNNHPRRDDR